MIAQVFLLVDFGTVFVLGRGDFVPDVLFVLLLLAISLNYNFIFFDEYRVLRYPNVLARGRVVRLFVVLPLTVRKE